MEMNQPNLQAILADNWTQDPMSETMSMDEAIDAIYAGLLAEVIGEDVNHKYHSQQEDAIRNALKAKQRQALKRWCYGDTSHE